MTLTYQRVADMASRVWFFDKGDRLILNVVFHPPEGEPVTLAYSYGGTAVRFLHEDLTKLLPTERELEPGELHEMLQLWAMIASNYPVEVDPLVYWDMANRERCWV
jgi:hypothetical protein